MTDHCHRKYISVPYSKQALFIIVKLDIFRHYFIFFSVLTKFLPFWHSYKASTNLLCKGKSFKNTDTTLISSCGLFTWSKGQNFLQNFCKSIWNLDLFLWLKLFSRRGCSSFLFLEKMLQKNFAKFL